MTLELAMRLLRDPRISALTTCAVVLATGFLYTGLVFEWGPAVVRPASAQVVQRQITEAKGQLSASVAAVQTQANKISDGQDVQARALHADRVERLDQQLLWYREKNCSARNPEARRLYFSKLADLIQRYHDITGDTWRIPNCSEIGSAP